MLKWEDLVSHRWCRRPLVAESCPPLCDPMDCALRSSSVHGLPRQDYWRGLPFPSPGHLPNPEVESASPAVAGRFFTAVLP